MPTISVVIPTCHRNDLLADCLQRLAPGQQTLAADKYEVIVTDDGRKSTAEAMIREKFSWARWVKGPQKGPAGNRNNGVRAATGDWIAFTDDDCLPDPGWLEGYYNAIDPATPIMEGRTVCKLGLKSSRWVAPVNENGNSMWSCNLFIQRSTYNELGGFDDSFAFWCEDMEFATRVHRLGYQSKFVPAAEVDHPPKPRPMWLKAARDWESRVFLESVLGSSTTGKNSYPMHILKVRTSQTLDYPWTWGSFSTIASGIFEAAYVLFHIRGWRRKHPMRKNEPKAEQVATG